ncbi:MAG: metallopeptidase TldD-related protein [Gammaproteobacteria bacterium]|jgi:predicted Zn-dependent protease
MRDFFQQLSASLFSLLTADEVLLLNFEGERSDFVRLNHNQIRQAGHVVQHRLQLTLIKNNRQCQGEIDSAVNLNADVKQAGEILAQLREQLAFLPEDPFINFATEPRNTAFEGDNQLLSADTALQEILDIAQGLDLVGLWAGGEVSRGFANSLGQFNWHVNYNFNFDWSVYAGGDKAIKQNYAGFQWNKNHFRQKIEFARQTLPLIASAPRTISPGHYRVFIAPAAMQEIMGLLNWGGFGLKAHRTAQTPLIKMTEEGKTLNPAIGLVENHSGGLTPCFTDTGFIKPDSVTLIDKGVYKECLAGARSAKEYGLSVNANIEHPQSLEINGGELHQDKILSELGTGIFISNLWYGNYSDRNHCRITGMTRFACLWVESGIPVAPLNVMRFDESIYHILGDKLVALTEEREHLFDTSSYGQRSQASSYLPGALVDDFRLTL